MDYIIIALSSMLIGYVIGRYVEGCYHSITILTPPKEITSVYEKGREHEW